MVFLPSGMPAPICAIFSPLIAMSTSNIPCLGMTTFPFRITQSIGMADVPRMHRVAPGRDGPERIAPVGAGKAAHDGESGHALQHACSSMDVCGPRNARAGSVLRPWWRGDCLPDDCDALLARVAGW